MASVAMGEWVLESCTENHEDLPKETVEYVVSIASDPDIEVDELAEVLVGLGLLSEGLDDGEKSRLAAGLVKRLKASKELGQPTTLPAETNAGKGTIDDGAVGGGRSEGRVAGGRASRRSRRRQNRSTRTEAPSVPRDEGDAIERCSKAARAPPKVPPAVLKLKELAPPGTDEELLAYILFSKNLGDIHEAAQYVLEHDMDKEKIAMVKDKENRLRKEQEASLKAATLEKKEKKTMLAKYLMKEEILDKSRKKNKNSGNKPKAGQLGKKKKSKNTQMYYRDGRAVGIGKKVSIIDDTVDWDGGSRGRVKSKGKRGVGWH
jgi:hypothetical protein